MLTESLEDDIKAVIQSCPDDKKYYLQSILDKNQANIPSNLSRKYLPLEFDGLDYESDQEDAD